VPKQENSNPHIGSSFDDFLEEEGIAAEVTSQAVREVIAQLVVDHMEQAKLTKTEMAARMHTSRQALARLLDPNGGGLTLDTLERAASAVGKKVRISFDDVAA
jgi:predicted XRE-type DNA-binding protein